MESSPNITIIVSFMEAELPWTLVLVRVDPDA